MAGVQNSHGPRSQGTYSASTSQLSTLGFAGITRSNSYNNRLLPTSLSASSSNGTALSLSYSYFANRNVNVETNGRDNGRSATYTYDALNRITTATSQATSGSDCWGQSFGYDRYANLTTINVTQCTAPMLGLSVNTNNQVTNGGFSYDAAGDLTADGSYTYSWNAEQHLNSAANVTYTYDGDLRRVKKSNGTLYWYCAVCGNVLAESDLSGNIVSEYALFNKQRIARRDVASGNVYYLFRDRLGSYRTLTDSTGHVQGESDYYPFGAERVISSTVTDSFRFASMEWDSEDGLNHTLYRKYTPAQGRWETPDPQRGCVNFPQGQNLYAYVKGDPTTAMDPLGLQGTTSWAPCGGEGQIPCGAYFTIIGQSVGWCPPMFQMCYSTLGGATIGITGSDATAFLDAVPVNTVGQPCSAAVIEEDCAGGLSGLIVLAQLTVQQPAANNGMPPQPTKLQETLNRAKTCAKAYYGFDTLPGAAQDATRVGTLIAAAPLPKSWLSSIGIRTTTFAGGSDFTSILSVLGQGAGTAASGTNLLRIAGRWAGPIAIASGVIDATAIGVCTFIDQ